MINFSKKILKPSHDDYLKSAFVKATGNLIRPGVSPDESLGDLFSHVQAKQVYVDGKTFADLIPRTKISQIKQEYLLRSNDENFNLTEFVNRHFYEYLPKGEQNYKANPNHTVRQHINELWDVLERRNRKARGSLLPLPHSYIVPGGRFSEQFYWDSYFIMLGLAVDDQWLMIENMMKNYSYMIRKFGFIPTANRSYFLSRSQPPFFSEMVRLLATKRGKRTTMIEYLPYMLAEYRFWMKGRLKASKQANGSYSRVVKVKGGYLNRYYDNKRTPRPESLREDVETADRTDRDKERLYLHLRAAAESGWDFSTRWMQDPDDISTIHTADIIPVDLNCLLYQLEQAIAETYGYLKNPLLQRKFAKLAENRKTAISEMLWNDETEFYEDYNFHHDEFTGRLSLAAVFPLYAGLATKEQADAVAKKLEAEFLMPGGLTTTLVDSGQQWDAPNGWAPLQWVAILGLRNYGHDKLADEIKDRWVGTCTKLFDERHKLVEKYDVQKFAVGAGGEYPLQDGFGWTNGVLAALLSDYDKK